MRLTNRFGEWQQGYGYCIGLYPHLRHKQWVMAKTLTLCDGVRDSETQENPSRAVAPPNQEKAVEVVWAL